MTLDPRYPSLDEEDLLEVMTDEQQKSMMKRKLIQIAEDEKANKKAQRSRGMSARLLKMYLTPRQDRLLRKLKKEWGMSVSEHVRRSIDLYLDGLITKGDLKDD